MKSIYCPSSLMIWFLSLYLIMMPRWSEAQTYPVQVTTSLMAPYSPELSYYTDASANNLQVFINVLELDRVDLRTKLRVTIEGAGVKLTTNPGYVPPALVLQGGVPEVLTGFDLRSYLNPDHMIFEGMTRAEFIRTGQFPEGFYTFTVEVLDYNRNIRISNLAMATAWIVLNDPPLINFPFNGEKVVTTEPQTINFSWTARHLASPNSAFSTEYEFVLYEMYPGQTNPEIAVRSSNSIFRTTTTQSSLFYGPADPILIPGKNYAFRIQAYDVNGRDLFKNQGYSETYSFQYGDACLGLKSVDGEVLGNDRIKVSWEPDFNHTGFELHYRQKGKSNWLTESIFTTSQILPDLKPDTEYEYKVIGMCQQFYGTESPIKTLTTDAQEKTEEEDFSCGAAFEQSDLNQVPLEKKLLPLDEFNIGGIDILVHEVTQNPDGSYSGTGHAPLPFFKGAGLKVKIHNVKLNENYQAIAGRTVTVYNADGGFIVGNTDDEEEDDESGEGQDGTDGTDGEIVTIDTDVDSVVVTDDGVVVILDEDGEEIEWPEDMDGLNDDGELELPEEGETLTVEDSNGDTWTVDSGGNVTEGGSAGGTDGSDVTPPDAVSSDEVLDFMATFSPSSTQIYGFDDPEVDGKKQNRLSSEYAQIQIQDDSYWVSWKSVATGLTDQVQVKTSKEQFPDYIGFKAKTGAGISSQPTDNENTRAFNVTGKVDEETEEIIAYVNQEDEEGDVNEIPLGQINVITYDKVREKVVIVPVNGATAPDAFGVSEELNRIYGQAVAEWEVEVANNYQVSEEIMAGLTEGESGLLSSYPSNMTSFNKSYKRSISNYDNRAYYVFIVPGTGDGRSGFMPFKKQYGYIWLGNSSNTAHTLAHELGHGCFRLRHTFSTADNAFVAAEGTTQNVMDYNNGTALYKHQWDYVHDPENLNSWFQDDEESAAEGSKAIEDHLVEVLNLYWCAKDNNRPSFTHYGFKTYISDWWGTEDLFDLVTSIKITGNLGVYDYSTSYQSGTETNTYSTTNPEAGGTQEFDVTTIFIDFPRLNSAEKIRLTFGSEADKIEFKNNILDAPDESKSYHYKKQIGEIPQLLANEDYDELRDKLGLTPPDCGGFDLLTPKNKISLIQNVLEDWDSNSDEEALILKLLQEENDKTALNNEIVNLDWKKLFRAIDDEREDSFEAILLSLAKVYKNDHGINIVGHVENENFGRFNFNNFYSVKQENGKVSLTRVTAYPVESNTPADWVKILEPVHPFDLITYSEKNSELDLSKAVTYPAILILKKIIENETQRSIDQLWLTVDVASLFFGIGEINLALKSTVALSKIGRVALGATDLLATATDIYCTENPDPELCEQWRQWGAYVQVGLIGVSALDQFKTLMNKSDEFAARLGSNAGGSVSKLDILAKFDDLPDAKRLISSLDEIGDAALLARIDALDLAKRQKLDKFYKDLKHPEGFAGQLNYTARKTIDGEEVLIIYKNGLPDLRGHSPFFDFPNGNRSKFKYESQSLTGKGTDFTEANAALAKEFGIEKVNNRWPKNSDDYVQSGNYRWDPSTSNFELFNTSTNKWDFYTWHHFEDGVTLFPVKSKVHTGNLGGFPHSGGKSIIGDGETHLKDLFEFLGF